MNAKHEHEPDHGDGLRDEALDQQQTAMGVGAQAALADGIVGGVDGRAGAVGAARETEAQEGGPAGEASADRERLVEGGLTDEETGLAPGESD